MSQEFPSYWIDDTGPAQRFVCIASPVHAVEIAETTDPHNLDPLGFEYRILRTARTVAKLVQGGQSVSKEQWFSKAAEMMLTHLGSIQDLVQLCNSARSDARMRGQKKADYSRVVQVLQAVKPNRRVMVQHKLNAGALPLLG